MHERLSHHGSLEPTVCRSSLRSITIAPARSLSRVWAAHRETNALVDIRCCSQWNYARGCCQGRQVQGWRHDDRRSKEDPESAASYHTCRYRECTHDRVHLFVCVCVSCGTILTMLARCRNSNTYTRSTIPAKEVRSIYSPRSCVPRFDWRRPCATRSRSSRSN